MIIAFSVDLIGRAAACTVVFGLVFAVALGQNAAEPEFPLGIRLPESAHGEAAIKTLGQRLPEVAAVYGKSPRQLREVFRSDRSLHVDPTGQLFFACPIKCTDCAEPAPAEAEALSENIEPTDPTPSDTSQAFFLHSRPGANRVIYLDFNGHADTSGRWKSGAESPPFDLDGNENDFNSDERNRIIGIWQRVAEDFSMYEIDVTTEDPGIEALRKKGSGDNKYGIRVVIGGSSSDWFGTAVGGVAFVGSFDANEDVPCWVFPKLPGTGLSEKNIAETVSHEVGHTLGLFHDGVTGGASYYAGQGNWTPIMGVSYNRTISQWSKGEYADANNTQDDLAVMLTEGAVYRADDHGNTIGSATKLNSASSSVSVNGVIERNTDLDFFQIIAAGGSLDIETLPALRGPNLRLEVNLYDSGGGLLQTATSADTSAGTQPVSLSRSVTPGIYYFSVDGIGNGDPLTTGYTDYASLGQYTANITGVVPGGSTWLATTTGGRQWNTAANWAPASVPNAAGTTVRINNDTNDNQFIRLESAITIGSLFLGDANSTHGYTLSDHGGSLLFDNSGSPAEISKTTGARDVISVPVQIPDKLVVSQSASGALEFSRAIGGTGSLTKSGAGTVVFNEANTYTGVTTLADGLLLLNDSNGLPGGIDNTVGTGESGLVFNGGVLGISADFTRQLGAGAGQLDWVPGTGKGSGGFAAFGANREVRLNNGTGGLSWNSAIIGPGNTLILSHPTATHTLDFKNGINFAGSPRTVRVEDGEADVDAILSGVLSGGTSSGLNKTGPGVLSLANANTYNGATTLGGGVLRLQHTDALPSGKLELTGGSILGLGAASFTTRTVGTGINQIQWTGEGGFAAFGTERAVKFSDSPINWIATNFIGGSRSLILGHSTADATLDWQQKISLAGNTRTIRTDDGLAAIDAKISGSIAGGSSGTINVLIKSGAGTLALTAQNTYWGDTIVNAGTLMIGDGNSTGGLSKNSQNILLESGAIFAVNRDNTVTQGTDPLMAAISGDGDFVQLGSGSTVLTLPNTYSGATSISAGKLILGASGVLPENTPVFIGDATLEIGAGYNDTVGTLEISGSATIHLGDASSTLSFSNSNSIAWIASLDITGAFTSGASIRFGTNASALTSSQLSLISINGNSQNLTLDTNGFLVNGYPVWSVVNAPATGNDPAADEDDDGVANAVEFVLGGSIHTNDSDKLPGISLDGGNIIFSFKRDQASIDGSTTIVIETGPDLSEWPTVYPVADGATSSTPGVSVIKNNPPGYDTVTLVLPAYPNLRKFLRLKVISH